MRRLFATALILAATFSPAQAMTVTEFLAKAEAIKAKGMMAMMSPDIGLLRNEMKAASTAYRTDIDTAQKAGKPAHSCPPPKGKGSITSEDVMAEFTAIPAPQSTRISVKDAFYGIMKKRYPCR